MIAVFNTIFVVSFKVVYLIFDKDACLLPTYIVVYEVTNFVLYPIS